MLLKSAVIDGAISLLLIAGQLCIAYRHRAGWIVWSVANFLLIAVAWQLDRYAQLPGYVVMTLFNVIGFRNWSRPYNAAHAKDSGPHSTINSKEHQ